MGNLSRIIYCKSHYSGRSGLGGAVLVEAFDLRADGRLHYQYNVKGRLNHVSAHIGEGFIQELHKYIPQDIFSKDLAEICKTKFVVNPDKTREQISLSCEYAITTEKTEIYQTILEWEFFMFFLDFPMQILEMILSFSKILKRFRAENQVN
jgi:hypothetical protein